MALGIKGFNRSVLSGKKMPENMPQFVGWTYTQSGGGSTEAFAQGNTLNLTDRVYSWGNTHVMHVYSPVIEVFDAESVAISASQWNVDSDYNAYMYIQGSNDGTNWSNIAGPNWHLYESGTHSTSRSVSASIGSYKYVRLYYKAYNYESDETGNCTAGLTIYSVTFS